MADYIVLRQTTAKWEVTNTISGKSADDNGANAAIKESFTAPGKYAALRIDNARIVEVSVEPKLTDV